MPLSTLISWLFCLPTLAFWEVRIILLLYNIIYTSPLMLLYVIYIRAEQQFNRLYGLIKKQISKWSRILPPVLTDLIAILLIGHAVSGQFW